MIVTCAYCGLLPHLEELGEEAWERHLVSDEHRNAIELTAHLKATVYPDQPCEHEGL